MSELPGGELAGVGVDAPPQGHFPPGDVSHHPEAPGLLHLGQAAAVPTYGLLQVDNEDPPFNFEFEAGGGEALQPPAPSGPQTAPTATADGVVGIHLQHSYHFGNIIYYHTSNTIMFLFWHHSNLAQYTYHNTILAPF
jgi:hypothetical protein